VRRLGGRPADPVADGRAGLAALAAVACAPVSPALCLLPLAWAVTGPALAARRAARAREAAVVDQLPDVVDLLRLTTDAGLPVGSALAAIGSRPGGPLGATVAEAAGLLERGGTTADALAGLVATAGPPVRPLVDALAEHDRYGTPLAPALARAAVEARARRRRQAEEAARRLPVTLLFPLVLTTLPAFFLLAIVPLLAGSLGSLGP
jgi:tight adherence protein C